MATWERYTSNITGFETRAYTGKVFNPRHYCDDPSGGVYTTKNPVAKLSMTPTVQFINTNIAWDVSESDSASGTIDTFDITWGGTTDIGDLSAQDWSVDPLTGNVQYTTAGTYTATLYVTDTGGLRSQAATVTIDIVDTVALARAFIYATDGANQVAWYYDPGGSPDKLPRTGLGIDWTNAAGMTLNSGILNPQFAVLATTAQHLWLSSTAGTARSVDSGTTWQDLDGNFDDPTNSAADGTPPTYDDLDAQAVQFDAQSPQRVYSLQATDSTWNGSNDPRIYLYWSDNYGGGYTDPGSWWLTSTVLTGDCVAAYRAIGAPNYAASLLNLNSPGTNDASTGIAPTWAAADGWTFNGSTQYLTTTITPTGDYTAIVRVAGNGTVMSGSLIGEKALNADFALDTDPISSTIVRVNVSWGNASSGPHNALSTAVFALTGGNSYRYDSGTLTLLGSTGGTFGGTASALYIGAENDSGASNFFAEDILAVAIYDRALNTTELAEIASNMAALDNSGLSGTVSWSSVGVGE